ncbi:MAG: hypothetical protein ACI9QC_000064 [Oceanicoccus sp.]
MDALNLKQIMTSSQFLKSSKWVLILTIVSTVLLFSTWSWLGFALPKALALSLGLSVFFGLVVMKGGRLELNRSVFLVLSYFLLLTIATIFSPAPFSSLVGTSSAMQGWMIQMLSLAIFVAALTMGGDLWKSRVWLYLMAIVSGYALIQWLGLDPLRGLWIEEMFLFRSFSTLANPNWLASFLVLGTPLIWLNSKGKERGMWLSLIVLALATTGSKAGFIGMGLLLLMLTGSWWAAAAILLLGGLSLLMIFPSTASLLRSMSARQEMWMTSFDVISAWPWGHGLDLYSYVSSPFATPALWEFESLSSLATSPHNILLEWLVEFGFVGLILILTVFASILWPMRSSPLVKGIFAYMVTLLFGFEVLTTGIFMWAMMGTVVSQQKVWQGSVPRRPVMMTLLILCLLNLAWLGWRSVGHWHYEQASEALSQNDLESSAHHFQRAIQIYPYDRVVLLEASEFFLALETDEFHPLVENYLLKCEDMDPECPILEAWLAAEQGDLELTNQKIREAFSMNPASIRTYYFALLAYEALGDAGAYEALKQELLGDLPENYDDEETETGRIFLKNYLWVFDL